MANRDVFVLTWIALFGSRGRFDQFIEGLWQLSLGLDSGSDRGNRSLLNPAMIGRASSDLQAVIHQIELGAIGFDFRCQPMDGLGSATAVGDIADERT